MPEIILRLYTCPEQWQSRAISMGGHVLPLTEEEEHGSRASLPQDRATRIQTRRGGGVKEAGSDFHSSCVMKPQDAFGRAIRMKCIP